MDKLFCAFSSSHIHQKAERSPSAQHFFKNDIADFQSDFKLGGCDYPWEHGNHNCLTGSLPWLQVLLGWVEAVIVVWLKVIVACLEAILAWLEVILIHSLGGAASAYFNLFVFNSML